MLDLLFGSHAGWFSAPALIGTAFFVIRLFAVGAGGDHELNLHDTGLAGDHGGDYHQDPSQGFKFLSLQGALAFMMGFGWGGLGALRGTGWSVGTSAIVGVLCGVAMVWLLCLLIKGIHDLHTSGNIRITDAHGSVGQVYLTVPALGGGTGQVNVTVDNRQRMYNAVSEDQAIPTGTRVRVLNVNQDNTLTVAAK